ncbi:MAG: cystathionine beta-lyase [Acidobacteria bacterium]|nr:cystathionine beta-lyase [Acidobacteriota bacterium]
MGDANHGFAAGRLHWRTRLIAPGPMAPPGFHSLAPAVHRGSTVVFDRLGDAVDDWRQAERYTYGLYGTPTTLELGLRIKALDGGYHCVVAPGGQAAIALVFMAYCRAGSHVLVPGSVYGPTAELAEDLLAGFGVEVERYDPLIGGAIASRIRPETSLIWCESPGSITMEVQDVPAIVAAARARGVAVALDNTYAAGVLFDAFAHGVDVSVQALTKYVGGHSDILLGTVSVANGAAYETVGRAHRLVGMAVSPDDCALALRGLQTLGVRLDRLERSTLTVARWLKERAEVAAVLHPALPDCPGHEIWARDFTGSASVFSIVLKDDWTAARTARFVDALRLFRIGFSWGGVTSLVMAYPDSARLGARRERLVRLNVGLEEPADLIDDLRQALELGTVPVKSL